jgi:putative ABC transport system permease protein
MCALGLEGDKIILNEKAAQALGFSSPLAAVGQTIQWGRNFKVAGVVKDYHHYSLHQPIDPVIFLPAVNGTNFSLQVTTTGDLPQKLATIEKLYRQLFPGNPFEYYFADEYFNRQYQADRQFGYVSMAFTGLAIFIACLGLFGLAAFTAQQRTKEIGIRKVLGATVANITLLLSKDFLKLVLLANILAWPAAWWVTHQWLQNFAYRMDLNPWLFVLAGSITLLIALLTVSYQAVKASLTNPVKSLRTE